MAAAAFLAGIVGIERELRHKSAGLRTHAIVGLAAALFTEVSKFGFGDVVGGHVTLDPSRVTAQIVTGVGFLGAGLIFVQRGSVRGLTTAAAVWLSAAIGMACGAGLVILAAAVTALHLTMLFGFAAVERAMENHGTTAKGTPEAEDTDPERDASD